jgi:2-methylfumaryl-CoA hydratase
MTDPLTLTYGRMLGDFEPGAIYAHPWELTISEGMVALYDASFLDATAVYASTQIARAFGFRDRPLHPLMLLNLGLSFSVHDVSEQAIAHLAYIDVGFPEPAYAGDTLSASSTVLSVKPSSSGDRGVVHVRTLLQNQQGAIVCSFERKALVRAGRVQARPPSPLLHGPHPDSYESARMPSHLRQPSLVAKPPARFSTFFDDLEPGQVYAHGAGRTVGDSEHMQLTTMFRNTHPLHFDAEYCREKSFTHARVVYGGLVLNWVLALTSRDLTANAIWDLGLDQGAHPNPVAAGDTLYAATRVEAKEDSRPEAGAVRLRVVGVKNVHPSKLLADGLDLFTPELKKGDGKIQDKVVEITRTVLLRKRGE